MIINIPIIKNEMRVQLRIKKYNFVFVKFWGKRWILSLSDCSCTISRRRSVAAQTADKIADFMKSAMQLKNVSTTEVSACPKHSQDACTLAQRQSYESQDSCETSAKLPSDHEMQWLACLHSNTVYRVRKVLLKNEESRISAFRFLALSSVRYLEAKSC